MRICFALLILLPFLSAGCGDDGRPADPAVPQEYLNLLPGKGAYSGAEAARRSITARDFKALAVGKDCITVPFFAQGCASPAAYAGHPVAWRLIPHTSDMVENEAFQDYAERFAYAYNAELAAYFRQHPSRTGLDL